MGQIPTAQELGNQAPRTRQGVAVASGQTAGLDALARLGQVGIDVSAKLAENDRRLNVYESSTEASTAINEFALNLENDPDFRTHEDRYKTFVQEQQKVFEERFKNDPRGLQQWKQNVDRQIERHGLAIMERTADLKIKEDIQRGNEQLDAIAQLTAISGDYDDGHEKAAGLIDSLVQSGTWTESEGNNAKSQFGHSLNKAEVTRDIGKDPEAALEALNGEKYPNLSPIERERFKIAARNDIEHRKAKTNHALSKQDKELVSDTILSYQQGMNISEDEHEQALASASRLGASELEALTIAKQSSEFIKLPAQHRKQILPQLQGAHNAERLKAFRAADETIKKEVERDGMAFGIAQGLVSPVDLDFSSPDLARNVIEQKLENAQYLTEHYGMEVSPLTVEETELMSRAIKGMTATDKTNLALSLGSSQKVWQQLDSKNAGLFAMAGAIGEPDVMTAIFEGQDLLKNKTIIKATPAEYLPTFDDEAGDVYQGEDRKHMIEAALAHYYATRESDVFDSGDFEDSIQAVSGGIGDINGRKIELPRGVDEDDFSDFIDEFTPEMVQHFGGVWSMSNENAAKVIQDAELVSVGQNRYMVVVENQALQAPSGQEPFYLSYDKELIPRKNIGRKR